MSLERRRIVLILATLVLFLGLSAPAAAGVTPTPDTPVIVNPPGGEDCPHRLVINITGCPPAGFVVSGWSEYSASNYSGPTGNKRFDKPWTGQPIDTGFDHGTSYRIFGWSDAGGFVYLFDFKSDACGDQYASYDFACVLTPTPTLTPTSTPMPELPETGGQGGMGVWPWVLAGAVLAFAGLRWRQLLKLVK